MLKQNIPDRQIKKIIDGIFPLEINWGDGGNAANILFSDGCIIQGSCIRCKTPPCLYYSNEELELEIFEDFPADKNENVCPTNAITWPIDSESPIIDNNLCIICGLCVSRCPVRAIYIDENGANLNDQPNKYFEIIDEVYSERITNLTTELFGDVTENGIYITESDELLSNFRSKFEVVSNFQSVNFPNHLARNLLIAVGIGTAMRRRGDTNLRMDLLLGPPGVEVGTGEVELGSGVLDAPRNIFDDIAVLVARYQVSKEMIVPIIISLDLPNLRSEYWKVIKDIRQVLEIKIGSITIGALIVILWNRHLIKIHSGDELYIDIDTPSLRKKIESIIGRELIDVTLGYPGFLESAK